MSVWKAGTGKTAGEAVLAARTVKRGIRSQQLETLPGSGGSRERKAVKANADFLIKRRYAVALAHSNQISRFWQKRC